MKLDDWISTEPFSNFSAIHLELNLLLGVGTVGEWTQKEKAQLLIDYARYISKQGRQNDELSHDKLFMDAIENEVIAVKKGIEVV